MQQLPRLRVLVVEEQPIQHTILCNLATCCGFKALPTNGGGPAQALDALSAREGEVDLLLMGWSSFMADAAAVWNQLRQGDGLRIPCIVHVPDNDDDKFHTLRNMGVDTALPRNFSAQTLRKLAARAVHSFSLGEPAPLPGHIAPAASSAAQPNPLAELLAGSSRPIPETPIAPSSPASPASAIAVSAPPVEETPAAKARRLFLDGREALKSRDHDRAIASFSKILAMRGRFPEACRGLAIAWQRKGDAARFTHYLNKAAEGYVWRGNNAEAEKLFADMKRNRCRAVNPFVAVAEVVLQRGRDDLALLMFEKALALEPENAAVRLGLARQCRALGRAEAALEQVVAVLQGDDRHEAALALYAELTGKPWHAPLFAEAGPGVWEVDALAACEELESSGPVLFLDGDAPLHVLDISAVELTPAEPVMSAAGQAARPAGSPDVRPDVRPDMSPDVSPDVSQNLRPHLRPNVQEPLAPSPAAHVISVTPPAPAPAAPEMTGAPSGSCPLKVLIVDDEPHIRMLLEETLETLEEEGVVLLYAEHGEEGLQLIKDERPNLVFLDVMMPRMNGFDVCDWVKNKLALEGVYVVMLTAKGQEFDSQRGLEAGADVYMTKPFRPSEVLMLARTVLNMD